MGIGLMVGEGRFGVSPEESNLRVVRRSDDRIGWEILTSSRTFFSGPNIAQLWPLEMVKSSIRRRGLVEVPKGTIFAPRKCSIVLR